MRITDLEAFEVAIPFRAPILSAFGVSYPARIRTFIRVHTDAGFVGLGEAGPSATHPYTQGTFPKRFEQIVKPAVMGENPADWQWLRRKLYHTPESTAVEIACWDLVAQAADVQLYRLLGGHGAQGEVPIAGYCFFRLPNMDGEGGIDLASMPGHCRAMQKQYGFRTLKVKLGTHEPALEAEVMERVREQVGYEVKLRIDPNGSWSLPTALRMIKRLDGIDLEYVEEPTRVLGKGDHTVDTAALGRLRAASATPVAADHCYRADLLAQIVRDNAADIVLADLFGCGGIADTLHYSRTAATFGLGVALHSGTELGVGQMAKLHVQAACPDEIRFAGDAIFPEYAGDVLVGSPLEIIDGAMRLPKGTGLGIELDDAKLGQWELTQQRKRELDAYWDELKGQLGISYPSADLLVRHF